MRDYNRQTGRTTRIMWKALIAASERPAQRIAFVCATANDRYWMFDRLVMLCPLYPTARAYAGRFTLKLPNDSTIEVRSLEEMHGPKGCGIVWDDVFEDHFLPLQAWGFVPLPVYPVRTRKQEKPSWEAKLDDSREAVRRARKEFEEARAQGLLGRVTMADIDAERLSEEEVERIEVLYRLMKHGPEGYDTYAREHAGLLRRRSRVRELLRRWWQQGCR